MSVCVYVYTQTERERERREADYCGREISVNSG